MGWLNEHIKCFLDTCLEEINRMGRREGSLHKESWTKVGLVFKDKFGLELTQKQLRNEYNTLKAKYLAYVYLRNKTGNIYNPQTNSSRLTPEEWDVFKKIHPKGGFLKIAPMPYPELCAALYDGVSASGNNRWVPTQTTSGGTSSSVHRVQTTEDNPFDNIDDDDDDGTSVPNATATATAHETPTCQEEQSGSRGRPNKRAKTSINLDELAVDMQKALQHLIKPEGPSIKKCHEKLNGVGLSQVDPLFLAAFNIFGQS